MRLEQAVKHPLQSRYTGEARLGRMNRDTWLTQRYRLPFSPSTSMTLTGRAFSVTLVRDLIDPVSSL